MKYWTHSFTPDTAEAFTQSDRNVAGFRATQRPLAKTVAKGDKFVCFLVPMSRWLGILEVLDDCFVDDTPMLSPDNDPFVVRFPVNCLIWLPLEKSIPVQASNLDSPRVFSDDSKLTVQISTLHGALEKLSYDEGSRLESLIVWQNERGREYEFDRDEYKKHLSRRSWE